MAQGDPAFLNVDLDLESREPLARLMDALPSLFVLLSTRMRGKYVVSLELSQPGLTLDQTIRRLAKMISSLSGQPRRLWQRATNRCFNIGFASGTARHPAFSIRSVTIQAVASLGASIGVTLYPYDKAYGRAPKRRRHAAPRVHVGDVFAGASAAQATGAASAASSSRAVR
jgi:hypothetical protein